MNNAKSMNVIVSVKCGRTGNTLFYSIQFFQFNSIQTKKVYECLPTTRELRSFFIFFFLIFTARRTPVIVSSPPDLSLDTSGILYLSREETQ